MEIPITEEFGLAHCWNNTDDNFPKGYENYNCQVLVKNFREVFDTSLIWTEVPRNNIKTEKVVIVASQGF